MSIFQTSRELSASPSEVFAAISDGERLARWWGPAGFTNTFDIFEFKTGGQWKFTMHGPNGANYPNESRFTEIVPDAKVVIRHIVAPLFELTITLSPSSAGSLLSWVQAFDDPAVAAAVKHIVEPSNEENLDRLAAEVSGRPH
ncbi:MAG TPA: SRPBCC family protein [Rhodocyclaceae bacterium]|nr:SRPBCC family protein [Rhodocyclaceae bacterium]